MRPWPRCTTRERNGAKDIAHKPITQLARAFPDAVHGFEDLEKQGMYCASRRHNRNLSKRDRETMV